ncbi:hypothetical protein F2Q70_00041538 [Brassica cretica]|uniref:Uncharacterized protein n=1 Tax=Brassica cretica TaxID=69181 RepID=A0A8S9RHB8_BRACR|nr:hypothetical protein F2Q70_00041538 [Brassica cretica]KAF3572105.1 hypothetical protein F2Q69_00063114 [Brassica cretica]
MRFGSFQGLSLQNYGHDWSGDGATDLEARQLREAVAAQAGRPMFKFEPLHSDK